MNPLEEMSKRLDGLEDLLVNVATQTDENVRTLNLIKGIGGVIGAIALIILQQMYNLTRESHDHKTIFKDCENIHSHSYKIPTKCKKQKTAVYAKEIYLSKSITTSKRKNTVK